MALLNKLAGRICLYRANAPSPLARENRCSSCEESRWLILIVIASFLALSSLGLQPRADPGWSHAVYTTTVHNPAGRSGAWLADLMLYIFGLSAWWWIMCCCWSSCGGVTDVSNRPATRRSAAAVHRPGRLSGTDRCQQRPGNPALLHAQGHRFPSDRVA
jgi:hypothetical protein